jgi:hypothetical protein
VHVRVCMCVLACACAFTHTQERELGALVAAQKQWQAATAADLDGLDARCGEGEGERGWEGERDGGDVSVPAVPPPIHSSTASTPGAAIARRISRRVHRAYSGCACRSVACHSVCACRSVACHFVCVSLCRASRGHRSAHQSVMRTDARRIDPSRFG